jgi:hypothetical protein
MDATLTHRGLGLSLTFPIMQESDKPVFSVDYGKPNMNVYQHGELQPRTKESRSRLEQYRIVSQLIGEFAYNDAILLADMIKSRQGGDGDELVLSVSGNNLPEVYPTDEQIVAPAAEQASALKLTYSPGRKNVVDVELTLTAVDTVRGEPSQEAVTPFDTGNGPVTLSRDNDSIDLTGNLAITRSVGRPNSSIRTTTRPLPLFTDRGKSASDTFDLDMELFGDGPERATTLARDIVRPILGADSLTLDFNGLFNMGAFAVVPDGSQALRLSRVAGRAGIDDVSTLKLLRVRNE